MYHSMGDSYVSEIAMYWHQLRIEDSYVSKTTSYRSMGDSFVSRKLCIGDSYVSESTSYWRWLCIGDSFVLDDGCVSEIASYWKMEKYFVSEIAMYRR